MVEHTNVYAARWWLVREYDIEAVLFFRSIDSIFCIIRNQSLTQNKILSPTHTQIAILNH
jgi:hypothetical protein